MSGGHEGQSRKVKEGQQHFFSVFFFRVRRLQTCSALTACRPVTKRNSLHLGLELVLSPVCPTCCCFSSCSSTQLHRSEERKKEALLLLFFLLFFQPAA